MAATPISRGTIMALVAFVFIGRSASFAARLHVRPTIAPSPRDAAALIADRC